MAETLKLIQFRAAYNLPIHAGIEFGIFARHGIALEIAYTPGSLYVSQSLKEGRCDIGHTGADDIIADVESDDASDLFIFMGLHSGLFSLVSAPDCTSIDSLRGKAIAVDAKASGFALVLERMLRSQGFAEHDYRPIEVGGWERRYTALSEGSISATLLTEPFVMNALAAGCHLLARDFDMIPSYQGTCGAASRRWAAQQPDRLAGYIRAYLEATRWCFDEKNRASCLDILARHNEIGGRAAEHTQDTLLDPAHGLYEECALNMSGVAAALDLRADLGYLDRPIPALEKYVDLTYYRKALLIDE
jgi:ABC-type nitrate/sulfonate/bicarbonate transport system substrate-binding protein